MHGPVNLADPEFEPTDEQLAGLMHRAFAGIAEAREQSLRELYADIAAVGARQLREHTAAFEAAKAAREVSLAAMGEARRGQP
jgi:hypothetical protein